MNQVVLPLLISASAALAAYNLSDRETAPMMPSDTEFPANAVAPDLRHLATYQDCSKQAESEVLSHSEAAKCLDAYLRLKLSFLPDIDMEAFLRLDPEERWAMNRRGYAAYVASKAGARPAM